MSDKNSSSDAGCLTAILFIAQIIIGTLYFSGHHSVTQWEIWQLLLPTIIWLALKALAIIFGFSLFAIVGLVFALFLRKNNGKS